MSSLLSSPSQINSRIQYLRSIGSSTEFTVVSPIQSLMTTTTWTSATTTATGTANCIYRDMGKRVTVIDPSTKVDVARYSQVQVVNGSTTEGVSGDYTKKLFVITWSASGLTPITVGRTG